MNLNLILTLISGITFITYGFICLNSKMMVEEFTRYKLLKFRSLTGILEILGGLGSLIGLFYQPLYLFSTLGLGILMALGVLVRLRIRDSLVQMLPAFILCFINLYLFLISYKIQ